MFNRSFAYSTIRDRLPVIIAKVVDYLCRDKLKIAEQFGEVLQTIAVLDII